jgi:hypothetical protein
VRTTRACLTSCACKISDDCTAAAVEPALDHTLADLPQTLAVVDDTDFHRRNFETAHALHRPCARRIDSYQLCSCLACVCLSRRYNRVSTELDQFGRDPWTMLQRRCGVALVVGKAADCRRGADEKSEPKHVIHTDKRPLNHVTSREPRSERLRVFRRLVH